MIEVKKQNRLLKQQEQVLGKIEIERSHIGFSNLIMLGFFFVRFLGVVAKILKHVLIVKKPARPTGEISFVTYHTDVILLLYNFILQSIPIS